MKSLTIDIPEEVNEKEFRMVIAAVLFDKGILARIKRQSLLAYLKEFS